MTFDAFATHELSRRAVVLGTLGCAGLVLAGCSPAGDDDTTAERKAMPTGKAARPASTTLAAMTVFRDPSCGCCKAWAEIARKAGYEVHLRDDQDMSAVKRRLGVPEELASCHTAEVGGMVIEGHVPLEEVARLLREKPQGIRGIAVPGMPLGSPGMETPDGTKQPFQVIAFDGSGKTSVFRA